MEDEWAIRRLSYSNYLLWNASHLMSQEHVVKKLTRLAGSLVQIALLSLMNGFNEIVRNGGALIVVNSNIHINCFPRRRRQRENVT